MRMLDSAGVLAGFTGTGETPLFAGTEIEWMTLQSEYRPMECTQGWMSFWFNEAKRLNIPIIAILDNNSKQVSEIDYPIYSNTGSTLPLFLIVSLIVEVLKT